MFQEGHPKAHDLTQSQLAIVHATIKRKKDAFRFSEVQNEQEREEQLRQAPRLYFEEFRHTQSIQLDPLDVPSARKNFGEAFVEASADRIKRRLKDNEGLYFVPYLPEDSVIEGDLAQDVNAYNQMCFSVNQILSKTEGNKALEEETLLEAHAVASKYFPPEKFEG